jgi:hypothetical protein
MLSTIDSETGASRLRPGSIASSSAQARAKAPTSLRPFSTSPSGPSSARAPLRLI